MSHGKLHHAPVFLRPRDEEQPTNKSGLVFPPFFGSVTTSLQMQAHAFPCIFGDELSGQRHKQAFPCLFMQKHVLFTVNPDLLVITLHICRCMSTNKCLYT